jgi:dUTP pyrophosphatase
MVYKMNQNILEESQTSQSQTSQSQTNQSKNSQSQLVKDHPNQINIQFVDSSLTGYYKVRSNFNTDSGYDLYCPETIEVKPHSVGTLDFKIRCSPNFQKVSGYYLYPRSSISKTPLMMANSVGIIDYGYRGNIMAKVYNTSDQTYVVKEGERLFQLCMPSLEPFNVEFVTELDSTERGTGGFGSTGSGNKI